MEAILSGSPAGASPGPSVGQRKDRGSVAAQACEECRRKKQKCDENRPRCSHCETSNSTCIYREPQPTKKDKTQVETLDRVKVLEGGIRQIIAQISAGFGQMSVDTERVITHIGKTNYFSPPQVAPASLPISPYPSSTPQRESSYGKSQTNQRTSPAHEILSWRPIKEMLIQAAPDNLQDLSSLEGDSKVFMKRMQEQIPKLPLDSPLEDQPFVGMQMQATRASGGASITFPRLSADTMHILASSYFDTFNLLYPFMDRTIFSDKLSKVNSEGFSGDNDSIIALLVFALGELSWQATKGEPIVDYKGRTSGLRGGSIEKPPGLALFNEALKRIGFTLSECDLENVQIFSLTALYYASCSRYMDFWRLAGLASSACHILISCNEIDWGTPRGELIKRVYWHCVIIETVLHLELDLPLTNIVALKDSIKLPSFNSPSDPICEADHRCNSSSHFVKHYSSHLAILRLCADLHNDTNDSTSANEDTPLTSNADDGGLSTSTLKRLDLQLDQWRSSLPPELQWPEDDPTVFPRFTNIPRPYNESIDPSIIASSGAQSDEPLFTSNLDHEAALYPYVYDIQVALLRTRYYQARYIVYRPSIYKALHQPDEMSHTDYLGVAKCLESCLKWPVALSPPSRHKRLIPFLFGWTRQFFSILLILHLSRDVPAIRQVREQIGDDFENDVRTSIELMIDWIRDLSVCDPIAMLCYEVLKSFYDMESLGVDRYEGMGLDVDSRTWKGKGLG